MSGPRKLEEICAGQMFPRELVGIMYCELMPGERPIDCGYRSLTKDHNGFYRCEYGLDLGKGQ